MDWLAVTNCNDEGLLVAKFFLKFVTQHTILFFCSKFCHQQNLIRARFCTDTHVYICVLFWFLLTINYVKRRVAKPNISASGTLISKSKCTCVHSLYICACHVKRCVERIYVRTYHRFESYWNRCAEYFIGVDNFFIYISNSCLFYTKDNLNVTRVELIFYWVEILTNTHKKLFCLANIIT